MLFRSAPATRFVATVAGLNLIRGVSQDGYWRAPSASPEVLIGSADATSQEAATAPGPLAAVFRPSDVRLERAVESTWTGALRLAAAEESTPGTWLARVVRVEQTPSGARVHTAEPAVAADVAADDIVESGFTPGAPVRVSVDPAAVRLFAAGT